MRKLLPFFILMASGLWSACTQPPDSIPLYEGDIPSAILNSDWKEKSVKDGVLRVSQVQAPNLTVYLPSVEKATGTGVVICPGGGYAILAIDHEGYQIAEWFNEIGVAAFVLKYRLPDDSIMKDKKTGPLQDAQQAIRLVRKKSKEWGLQPDKIGIMGFSAGGHLASTALTHHREIAGGIQDTVSCKPDFGILIYPVISMMDDISHIGSRDNLLGKTPSEELIKKYSTDLQVDAETPPTFLVSTEDDFVVPENSRRFSKALEAHGVNTELHIYETGGHGYGLAKNNGPPSSWPARCKEWMNGLGLL